MNEILRYLKKHGEQLDAEIAKAAGLSLSKTRLYLAELAAKGEVVVYHSTRYEEGHKIEGIRCRLYRDHSKGSAGQKIQGYCN